MRDIENDENNARNFITKMINYSKERLLLYHNNFDPLVYCEIIYRITYNEIVTNM